jgi:hypothetical protein
LSGFVADRPVDRQPHRLFIRKALAPPPRASNTIPDSHDNPNIQPTSFTTTAIITTGSRIPRYL